LKDKKDGRTGQGSTREKTTSRALERANKRDLGPGDWGKGGLQRGQSEKECKGVARKNLPGGREYGTEKCIRK